MHYGSMYIGSWQALQERFYRDGQSELIRDIYDGQEYKMHSEFLSCPSNVSLTMNTDGIAIFKSTTMNVWPIWLVINELPKRMRFV